MHIKVVYHSKTGNTKKLANAIAEELNIKAEEVTNINLTEPVDLLFVGDGIYAGKPNKAMIGFIEGLNSSQVKQAAVFATYGGQKKIGGQLKELIEDRGIKVVAKPYICRGKSWAIANRNHPSEEEINGAKKYAKEVVSKIG